MCILETKGRNPSLLRLNKLGLVTVRACAYVCVRVRACVRACMPVYYDILVTVALVVQYLPPRQAEEVQSARQADLGGGHG